MSIISGGFFQTSVQFLYVPVTLRTPSPVAALTPVRATPQERIYPAWNWVCIEVQSAGDHMMDFLELAMYMQGENEAGELMQLTIPVMMQRRAGGGAAMCAPLPASHQAILPAPLTDNIRLVAVPETAVYVRRFGGVAQRQDWAEQAGVLQRHLTEAERPFRSTVISAMFSDPAQREGRRNEIWLIKA